jgi:hypothetical protein
MNRDMLTSFAISAGLTFILSFNSGIIKALIMATIVGLLSVGVNMILRRK